MLVQWLLFLRGNSMMTVNTIPSPGLAFAQIIWRKIAIHRNIFRNGLIAAINFEL
jgi:hypothetical protein